MKKLLLAMLLASSSTAFAATPAPVRQIIFNVDASAACSKAAEGAGDLAAGLESCNLALRNPAAVHRDALMVNRGVIQARLGDNQAALADYNAAIAANPQSGDAYVSRAGVMIVMKRYDDALADANRAMQLHTSNMAAAYYSRAVVADERGNYNAAYADYKQALALKPDFGPAAMQIGRFKVTTRTASN
jgi:tetratricopeptide (TPR) repeat protein